MSAYISGTVILINNLRGKYEKDDAYYIPPEKVFEILRENTGQDFGYDIDMWIKFHNGELDDSYYAYIREKYGSEIRSDDDSEA